MATGYNYRIAKNMAGKKFLNYPIDNMLNAPDKILFIRGIIESMKPPIFLNNIPFFRITSKLKNNIELILDTLNLDLKNMIVQNEEDDSDNNILYNLYLIDTNCLDFFGKLYQNIDNFEEEKEKEKEKEKDEEEILYDKEFFHFYLKMCGSVHDTNTFKFIKTRQDAVTPFKGRISDSGYDLTLLEKIKSYGSCDLYETGIKIQPKFGFYFDMIPRSSIIKTGYMLANNVGIIDASYRESIKVALIKVDPNAKPLTMPCRLVQLIPRKIYHQDIREVDNFDFTTDRDLGGFGSSNT